MGWILFKWFKFLSCYRVLFKSWFNFNFKWCTVCGTVYCIFVQYWFLQVDSGLSHPGALLLMTKNCFLFHCLNFNRERQQSNTHTHKNPHTDPTMIYLFSYKWYICMLISMIHLFLQSIHSIHFQRCLELKTDMGVLFHPCWHATLLEYRVT